MRRDKTIRHLLGELPPAEPDADASAADTVPAAQDDAG